MRFAVAHAVHGFAAQNFRQVFLLLLRRAEHHQRVGLDRCARARRFAPLHGLDESDLLKRRARLTAKGLRPAQADPSCLAHITREFRIELALGKRLRIEGRLALARPVLFQPGLHRLAQLVAGGTEIVEKVPDELRIRSDATGIRTIPIDIDASPRSRERAVNGGPVAASSASGGFGVTAVRADLRSRVMRPEVSDVLVLVLLHHAG